MKGKMLVRRWWPVALVALALGLGAYAASRAAAQPDLDEGNLNATVLEWHTMVGVGGPFLGAANPIRGINGGGRPWVLDEAHGKLRADGRLHVVVKGLIIPASEGPQFGINPVAFFRAAVSCLTVDEAGNVVTHNVFTDPASTKMLGDPRNGDALIEETLVLPSPCVAPIVFVTSPTGSWFAVTGEGFIPTTR